MKGSIPGRLQLSFAVLLAVAFFLPVAEHPAYVTPDGEVVKGNALLPPAEDSETTTAYIYVWEDPFWIVPVIFFLPLALTVVRMLRLSPIALLVFEIVTPLIAVGLLLFLNGVVAASTMFFGRTAYGGYIAIAAMIGFILTGTVHGIVSIRRRLLEAEGQSAT